MRKALFIDRDGTINYDNGYTHSLSDLKIYKDIPPIIKKYKKMGYLIICITNQSGIGRGYYTEKEAVKFNKALNIKLSKMGARIDAFYLCPHSPADNCRCRKPKTFLAREAAKDYGIDIKGSLMIGDNRASDGGMAKRLSMEFRFVKKDR